MVLALPSACVKPAPAPMSPAECEVSSLVITPTEAVPAEPVTISVTINNTGGTEGTYSVTLTLNGVKAETKIVKIAPQSAELVSFTVIKDKPGIYAIGVDGLSGTFQLLKPAEFTISNLVITPAEAEIGETVTVTVDITNTGEVEGNYRAMLEIDGARAETKDVTIPSGITEKASFTLAKDVAGIYRIEVAELTGVLVVKGPQGLPSGYIVEKNSYYEDNQIEIYDITYMSDGLKVKGYLTQPKAPGTYPAVIWNRGGNREYGLLEPLALKPYAINGYVAVGSQYRGNGGGEGREEFGGADVNDVLNLIPLLKSLPDVDVDRIGMVGYSRGGMMTYIALKEQTLRGANDIKAACTVGGVTDLFMCAKERPDMLSNVLIPLIGGSPSQVSKEYEARSSTYWADKINVPLLLQHGEADWRVSVEQARKLAQELDKYGKIYKLITYPGDDHGLSNHGGGLSEILRWLSQCFK